MALRQLWNPRHVDEKSVDGYSHDSVSYLQNWVSPKLTLEILNYLD